MESKFDPEYLKLIEVLRQLTPEERERVYCFCSGIVQAHKILENRGEH